MIIKVKTPQGYVEAHVDANFSHLAQYNWFINGKAGYAARNGLKDGKRYSIYMHRVVMNAQPGEIVDHINHDRLDNRKANLRLVTKAQNAFHQRGGARGASGITGVYWTARRSQWRAMLGRKHLGWFRDKQSAVAAREQAFAELQL